MGMGVKRGKIANGERVNCGVTRFPQLDRTAVCGGKGKGRFRDAMPDDAVGLICRSRGVQSVYAGDVLVCWMEE
jgi:hypothetical protein